MFCSVVVTEAFMPRISRMGFDIPLGGSLQADSTILCTSCSSSPSLGITCISSALLLSQIALRFTANWYNFTFLSPSCGSPPFRFHHSSMISAYGLPLNAGASVTHGVWLICDVACDVTEVPDPCVSPLRVTSFVPCE